jgi:nitrate reductase gamma subunit
MKARFLFQVLPYAASALLVAGMAIRFALSRADAAGLDDQLARARSVFRGGRIWRLAVLVLLVAHLLALLAPAKVELLSQVPLRLYLLEGSGLLIGVLVLVGWSGAIGRHLGQREGSRAAAIADAAFLAVTQVAILSGLLTALFYRWGSRWSAATLTPYLASLVGGQPSAGYVTQMPFLVQLHVVAAFGALALLPFCGVAALGIAAVDRTLRWGGTLRWAGTPRWVRAIGWVARPFAVGGRVVEAWLRRHNPAAWIWPEED